MKNLLFFLLVVSLLSFNASAKTQINVTNGSGDGIYRGQRIVDIWANPSSSGQVFDRWTGDVGNVQNIFEAHTKVKTGKKVINLTATYKNAPAWLPTALETVGTSEMRYYFPPNAGGVIFHFHGAGGSANGLFQNIEQRIFANDAVAQGYAIVTLSSEDRINRQWSPNLPPNNPDIVNVQTAIATLTQRGLMNSSTPIFASGISNGGGFAPRVSLALNFRGTAIHIAAGTLGIMSQTTVPTIWSVSQNDSTIGQSGVQQSFSNYNNLLGRSIQAQYNLLKPSPVYPERFWRIPNLSQNDSNIIYNSLKNNGFLDDRDYLLQSPLTSSWQSVIPPQYNSSLSEIFSQLKICWTEHEFQSDYNYRILNFFNSLR